MPGPGPLRGPPAGPARGDRSSPTAGNGPAVKRTILDMIIYERPDQANAARGLS